MELFAIIHRYSTFSSDESLSRFYLYGMSKRTGTNRVSRPYTESSDPVIQGQKDIEIEDF